MENDVVDALAVVPIEVVGDEDDVTLISVQPPVDVVETMIFIIVGCVNAACLTRDAIEEAARGLKIRFGLSNQLLQLSCSHVLCVQLLNWLLQHQWTLPAPMSLHTVSPGPALVSLPPLHGLPTFQHCL